MSGNLLKSYDVRVEVTLRPLVHDPQGQLIAHTIKRLALEPLETLRVGKLFQFALQANDASEAQQKAEMIAERVLANPQLERYHCEVTEVESCASP